MPDPFSPIQRIVMLRRVNPEHRMARFYSLMIERGLFGTVRLVRHAGAGAGAGHPTEEEAMAALERLAT